MKLRHLALAVRDQERSIDFYAKYFGFDPATARRYPDGVIIIRDADDFALALGKDEASGRLAGFPHFGFHVDSAEEVRRLRARLVSDGVGLLEDEDSEDFVSFKCLDPDNHVVEVAWAP